MTEACTSLPSQDELVLCNVRRVEPYYCKRFYLSVHGKGWSATSYHNASPGYSRTGIFRHRGSKLVAPSEWWHGYPWNFLLLHTPIYGFHCSCVIEYLVRTPGYLLVFLMCIFLMTNNVEHHCRYALVICTSSLVIWVKKSPISLYRQSCFRTENVPPYLIITGTIY